MSGGCGGDLAWPYIRRRDPEWRRYLWTRASLYGFIFMAIGGTWNPRFYLPTVLVGVAGAAASFYYLTELIHRSTGRLAARPNPFIDPGPTPPSGNS